MGRSVACLGFALFLLAADPVPATAQIICIKTPEVCEALQGTCDGTCADAGNLCGCLGTGTCVFTPAPAICTDLNDNCLNAGGTCLFNEAASDCLCEFDVLVPTLSPTGIGGAALVILSSALFLISRRPRSMRLRARDMAITSIFIFAAAAGLAAFGPHHVVRAPCDSVADEQARSLVINEAKKHELDWGSACQEEASRPRS